jgi:hypothetical protein
LNPLTKAWNGSINHPKADCVCDSLEDVRGRFEGRISSVSMAVWESVAWSSASVSSLDRFFPWCPAFPVFVEVYVLSSGTMMVSSVSSGEMEVGDFGGKGTLETSVGPIFLPPLGEDLIAWSVELSHWRRSGLTLNKMLYGTPTAPEGIPQHLITLQPVGSMHKLPDWCRRSWPGGHLRVLLSWWQLLLVCSVLE